MPAPPLLAKPSKEYIGKFKAGQVKSPTFVSADLALEVAQPRLVRVVLDQPLERCIADR